MPKSTPRKKKGKTVAFVPAPKLEKLYNETYNLEFLVSVIKETKTGKAQFDIKLPKGKDYDNNIDLFCIYRTFKIVERDFYENKSKVIRTKELESEAQILEMNCAILREQVQKRVTELMNIKTEKDGE